MGVGREAVRTHASFIQVEKEKGGVEKKRKDE